MAVVHGEGVRDMDEEEQCEVEYVPLLVPLSKAVVLVRGDGDASREGDKDVAPDSDVVEERVAV